MLPARIRGIFYNLPVKFSYLVLAVAFVGMIGCGDKGGGTPNSGTPAEGHTHVEPEALGAIMTKAKNLGMPTTLEEFQDSRNKRADEAGPIYLQLITLMENADMDLLDRYLKGQATDEEADKAIAGLADEFATMDKAVAKPSFAPKRDFSRGMQIDYKEYDPMQRTCIAYVARALRSTRKGNTTGALVDFRKAAAVAEHASSEDVAMSEYLTTVCIDHWSRGATKAAEASSAIRPGLVEIMKQLPEVDARAGIGTDFVMIKQTIDRIRGGEVTYSEVAGYDDAVMVEGKSMDDLLMANIDMAERYALQFVVRAYEAWEDRGNVLQLLHDAEHAAQEETGEHTVVHAFEALAMTFTAPLKNGEALTVAELETLQIAIAAADLKKRNGKAPTLDEAAAAAGVGVTDPFTSNKYVLKDGNEGVTVYSVGLDLEDNEGKAYTPGEAQGTDISVTLK
jgi:hypothetical protein